MKLKNIALAGAILFSSIAQAAIIYPTQNYIGLKTQFSGMKTATFYLDNTSGKKVEEYEVSVKKWTDYTLGKGAVQEETEVVKIFPNRVVIPPGKKAPVRLLYKGDLPNFPEYYRVTFLDDPNNKKYDEATTKLNDDGEIISGAKEDNKGKKDENNANVKISMPFAYSMPIFAFPGGDKYEPIKDLNKSEVNGKTILKNNGNLLYKYEGYILPDGKKVKELSYIFPGKELIINNIKLDIQGSFIDVTKAGKQ